MLRNLLARFRPHGRALPAECEHVRSRLLPYLDRDLGPAERSIVESHLENCASCRAEMAAHRHIETMLGTAAATIPSPGDLRTDFYARLEKSRRRQGISPWLLAAPALTAAAVLLFVFGHRGGGGIHTNVPQGSPPALTVLTENHPGTTHREFHGSGSSAGKAERTPYKIVSTTPSHRRLRIPHNPAFGIASSRGARRAFDLSRRSIDGIREQTFLVAPASPIDSEPALPRFGRQSALVDTPLALYTAPIQQQDTRNANESRDTMLSYRAAGRVALTSLVTELHVSDENRDFMSSTHVDSEASRKDRIETLRVDDDNDNAQESTELPALP
jgi:hypothetical protein